jgi:polysaccharide export outer membrane protein
VNLATVAGAVLAPGEYPIMPGYTANDLVSAAGGLSESADLTSVELRRIRRSVMGNVEVDYSDIRFDRFRELERVELQSRDHITVRQVPDWNPDDTIEIRGEVYYPGTYVISSGDTLSEIIRRAGGLTELGFPEGAVFTRQTAAQQEIERAAEYASDILRSYSSRLLTEETTTSTMAEVIEITQQLENFEGVGRILVNLSAAIDGEASADYVVEDGDVLLIPRRSSTVTVVGEVKESATHVYQQGLLVKDYIDLSAGASERADEEGIYIVRANGSNLRYDSKDRRRWWRFGVGRTLALEPGDTIVVPVDSRHKESLTQWRDVTQILYQSLVSVAAVARMY